MAKKYEVGNVFMPFAEVMWDTDINKNRTSRNYGTEAQQKAIRQSLAEDCWWPGEQIEADIIEGSVWKVDGKDVPLTEQRDKELKRRKAQWDAAIATAAANPSKANELLIFERMFVHNGKLIVPKVHAIVCHRRASEFFTAMVQRSQMRGENQKGPDGKEIPDSGKPLELNFNVPVATKDWSNEEARIIEQVRENDGKMRGNLPTSELDRLAVGQYLVGHGANQNKLRKVFGASNGVRIYHLVMLDAMFPSVQIIERLNRKPGDPGWINITAVKYPILQDMAQRLNEDDLKKQNNKLQAKGEDPKGLCNLSEVEKYFADVKKNPTGDGADRVMDKNGIYNISVVTKNDAVKIAADVIHKNAGKERLDDLNIIGPVCNTALNFKHEGDYPELEVITLALAKLPKGKQRDKAFKACKEALGVA